MTIASRESLHAVTDRVADVVGGVYETIDGWRDLLVERLRDAAVLTAAEVDPIVDGFGRAAVADAGPITGAGFVAAPGLLADATWHLSWWLGGPGQELRRLRAVSDPAAEGFRDYTMLEWWRAAVDAETPHLTGPYVDYVCTEDYAITITTRVVAGGRLLGVCGADVLVDRLEHDLLPALRSCDAPAALVNATGRVLTATPSRIEPGSILRLDGLAEALEPLHDGVAADLATALPGGAEVRSCRGIPLALVVGF
jgi:hypothetical protein